MELALYVSVLVALVALTAAQTKMVLWDKEHSNIHQVEVEANNVEFTKTTADAPSSSIQDMDYDFVQERLYYITDYSIVKSCFVNGTGDTTVKEFSAWSVNAIAVDPYQGLVFVGNGGSIIKMGLDGSDTTTIVTRDRDITELGVDYENSMLYWEDNTSGSKVLRTDYSGAEPYEFGDDVYMSRSPHAIDFNNNILYGQNFGTVSKFNMVTGDKEELLDDSSILWSADLVYDPHTDRIFITMQDKPVYVYSTDGVKLGEINTGDISLKTFLRINPQLTGMTKRDGSMFRSLFKNY